jgi:hypothetical protein
MNTNEFARPQDDPMPRLLSECAKYMEGVDERLEQLDKEIESTEKDVAEAKRSHGLFGIGGDADAV